MIPSGWGSIKLVMVPTEPRRKKPVKKDIAIVVLTLAFLAAYWAFIHARGQYLEERRAHSNTVQTYINNDIRDFKATRRPSKDR